jgi:adenylosuccinate synthase
VGDVGAEVDSICDKGGSVLFEGSQGALLDLVHGSYPFVTSSQTVAGYIPASVGVRPSRVGRVMGVTKCYTTRVGGGPFPTEIEGELAARIRETGREYGATTGRPRRVGWLDLVALRYAIRLNGADEIAFTKVDVISAVGEFKACKAYRLGGLETSDFRRALGRLEDAVPIYDEPLDLSGLELSGGAPAKLKRLVDYLEKALRVKVRLVSFGEDRKKTLEL